MKTHKMPALELDAIMPHLIGVWRRFMKIGGPGDVLQTREFRGVVAAVQELQQGLETSDKLIGQDYFNDPALLGAYILYQWVIHYQQGLALINEIPETPKRVLDVCSGPGAFAFAALRQGAREVVALDQNANALRLAGEICGRYGFPLTSRCCNVLRPSLPIEGKFDLIIVGHCLTELFPSSQKNWIIDQRRWLDRLCQWLTPEGKLLIVDSSLPAINHRFLHLRDQLVQEGVPVQAPCVWRGPCPALQSNSYCYAQRPLEKTYLMKEIQRAVQINLSSLKMSYLLMRTPSSGWPALPDYPLYRVISPPIDSHTGKRYYLCGTDGKKDLGSRLPEQSLEARAFDYLKRGELIAIEDALVNQNHFDIVLGTRIKVEAALNKPLPPLPFNEY